MSNEKSANAPIPEILANQFKLLNSGVPALPWPQVYKIKHLAIRLLQQKFVKEKVVIWTSVNSSVVLWHDATFARSPIVKFPHY